MTMLNKRLQPAGMLVTIASLAIGTASFGQAPAEPAAPSEISCPYVDLEEDPVTGEVLRAVQTTQSDAEFALCLELVESLFGLSGSVAGP